MRARELRNHYGAPAVRTRRARVALPGVLLTVTAVLLTACGSDTNGPNGPSGPAGHAGQAGTGRTTGAPSGAAAQCARGTLAADGSTAQQNAMTQWIKDYQTRCPGTTITYGGGGSGQGVTDFTNKQVDFAGSDAALDPAKGEVTKATAACGSQAIDLPMVVGPIAIAYHVKGVDRLVLPASVIARIFTGKITKWNDPAIAAANSGAALPSARIAVFNRADASGTTQNFETYLAASAPADWTAKPSKQWAGVGQGKKGNQLLGQAVQATAGSIGYVEWSYAIQNNLSVAEVDNGAGPVQLSAATVGKTVATAAVHPSGPGDLTLRLDYATRTPGAYPIVLVTYEIVCTKYRDAKVGALVRSFLGYAASAAAQQGVHALGYAALPEQVSAQVRAQLALVG